MSKRNQNANIQPKKKVSMMMAIPERHFSIGRERFAQLYSAPSGIHYRTVKIKYTESFKNIFTLKDFNNGEHLVFHYGFSPDEKFISYLIGLAIPGEETFTFLPFPRVYGADDGYYQISENASSIQKCTVDNFSSLTENYMSNILRAGVPIQGDENHPRMVIHPKNELKDFDCEYKYHQKKYMYVTHGAGLNRPHTPMFQFGDKSGPFGIDDIDYSAIRTNTLYKGTRYTNKAFNIGQLCPPDCRVRLPHLSLDDPKA